MALRPQTDRQTDQLQPPQSAEVEQVVLGAMLKDPEAVYRVLEVIHDPADFYSPRHQMIFEAARDLAGEAEPVDIVTVANRLQDKGQIDKVGGRVYLVELVEQIASTGNVGAYAKIVLEKSVVRRLIATSNEIVKSCYSAELEADELLDQAEANIFAISESRLRKGFVPIKDLIDQTLDTFTMRQREAVLTGLPTGFVDLDEQTLGLHRGELIVIAGRPSMGKTALAMNIVENICTRAGESKSAGVFSLEMSKEALVLRMLCGRARVNQHKVRSGSLDDAGWRRLPIAGDALKKARLYIDDSASLTPLDLRAKARRLKAQHGLDVVVVDYIQLMHSTSRTENRQQEIALITRSLKSLAKELDIPVVALSQLSRAVEHRGYEKRPQLADLRESGAIEQDADVVLLLNRPEFYLSPEERSLPKNQSVIGKAEVNIAKQRNGPTGSKEMAFISEFARFESLERARRELPRDVEPVGGEDETPF